MALVYSNRAFLFSVIVMLGLAYEKIFQAVGSMKFTMLSMLGGFVTNIVLDPLLIFGIGFFRNSALREPLMQRESGSVSRCFCICSVIRFVRFR